MKADIVTIFPDFFRGPLEYGITRRAQEMGLAEIRVHDLREFTHDRHRTVDDRPFGGGEGMVLKPEPLFECLESIGLAPREERLARRVKQSVVLLSAQGQRFSQKVAAEFALLERIVLVCGRYEGVDERVAEYLATEEISVGDYVLSGGELPAMLIIDAVTRLIPGALGNEASSQNESFSAVHDKEARGTGGARPAPTGGKPLIEECTTLLDFPHYTRPADFRGWKVPDVLIGGNHAEVANWRRAAALEKTQRNRPDLLLR